MTSRRQFMLMAGLAAVPFRPVRGWSDLAPMIGVCRSLDHADAAREGGAEFLEVSCRQWLIPERPAEEFRSNLARLRATTPPPVAANSFLPGRLKCTGPEADHDAVVAFATTAFERAKPAGIEIITFGSGGARQIPAGWPRADAELQFVALLTKLGTIAKRHDVTVCVEPLRSAETNFINLVSEAQRLVSIVNMPNVGITADFYHMLQGGESAEAIRAAGPWIRHVHIAENRGRTAPGQDGDDFRAYFKALADVNYRGLVSIECRWGDLSAELPMAIRTIRHQIETMS